MTIAESSDEKKISLHILTSDMRFPNITKVEVFIELVYKKLPVELQGKGIIDNIAKKQSFSLRILRLSKYKEKTDEHVRVKKAVCPNDRIIFNFMIHPPNDDSEVIDSPLLAVSEPEVKKYNVNTNNKIIKTEFELVEKLLQEASVEGFNLLFPSEQSSNIFSLKRISPSYCSLCDQEYINENAYIIQNKKSYSFHYYRADQERQHRTKKPLIKLTPNESVLS
ncbi:hypothetical protein RclHR1_14080002 [Rhizophagus clarus]|uniref:Uncharacterized protein n=1 Tax=Rhizophagus clarus TaxID=94130 RepID=A0A2Z6QDI7_9GLOM|nr:hypothetical protein RclHR1_14080002 [Rhizophagus clarus]